MNFKSNKGITLVTMVISIIIIMVISGTIIYNTSNQISMSKINNLYTDIETISSKVDNYYMKYGELPTICEYKTSENYSKKIFSDEIMNIADKNGATPSYYPTIVNPNDGNTYYVIDLEKLEGLSLKYGYDDEYKYIKENKTIKIPSRGEFYVINGVTHQVYFPHGVLVDNIMYYTKDLDKIKKNGATPKTKADLKVGDYVNYTYDGVESYNLEGKVSGYTSSGNYNETTVTTQPELTNQTITRPTTALKWQILSINQDGSIDLVSSGIGSNENIFLQGSLGYNNGVYVLNDIANKFYTNTKLGSKAKARSINVDDIERHFTDAAINARNSYTFKNGDYTSPVYGGNGATASSGTTQTMAGTKYYPKLYEQEKYSGVNPSGTKDQSDSVYISPTSDTYLTITGLTVTQTYYGFYIPEVYIQNKCYSSQINDIGQASNSAYNLIFGTSAYWLASRFINCITLDNATLGFNFVSNQRLNGDHVFRVNGIAPAVSCLLRPVIHLDKSVNFSVNAGTEEDMHEILY